MNAVAIAHDPGAEHGEGPTWDAAAGRLIWVDLLRGIVHRLDPATGDDEPVQVGQPVGAAVPRAGGGLALAVRDGFALLDPGSERPRMVAEVEADTPSNRMNDGKCDSAGRFWAGTMALDSRPGAGALYRLDPDMTVTTTLSGVSISNGLGWSPDDRTMYYVDSGEQAIDAFDFDVKQGRVTNRRRLAAIEVEAGTPDGIAVDVAGCLWVALWGGGAVRRYSPAGDLLATVRLPATQLTSCTFGGPELRDIYVTSASSGLSAEERRRQPYAGVVFRVSVDVPGALAARFGG